MRFDHLWGDVENQDPIIDGWQQHETAVYNYFRKMGVQPSDAADLAQETFVRAMVGARRYRGEGSVRAWVIGIARNLFREWLRQKSRGEVPTDVPPERPRSGSDEIGPEIEAVLSGMARDSREVLIMRFVLDLSSQDTAVALGISDEAVRQRVTRARVEFEAAWGDLNG